MIGIILMVAIGITCLVICYKMTDSIFATLLYGVYATLIIFLTSLLLG